MSQIKTLLAISALVLGLMLSGCADKNSQSGFDTESGTHAADWVSQHWQVYDQATGNVAGKTIATSTGAAGTTCATCHGTDLTGGQVKVSCFVQDLNGMRCHFDTNSAQYPGNLGHPPGFGNLSTQTSVNFHNQIITTIKNKYPATLVADCGRCHALDASNGTAVTTTTCFKCHNKSASSLTIAAAANQTGCVSCHGGKTLRADGTAGPNGSTFPNTQNAHGVHTLLAGVTCSTCHNGFGDGTNKHANSSSAAGKVGLNPTYNAETGTFSYDQVNHTCTSALCHGGQTTPAWSGHLDKSAMTTSSAYCQSCHAAANGTNPQYNDYYSGGNFTATTSEHTAHLGKTVEHIDPLNLATTANLFTSGRAITCLDCHNIDLLTAHWGTLATPSSGAALSTLAGNTIGGGLTQISGYVTSTKTCTTACHTGVIVGSPKAW